MTTTDTCAGKIFHYKDDTDESKAHRRTLHYLTSFSLSPYAPSEEMDSGRKFIETVINSSPDEMPLLCWWNAERDSMEIYFGGEYMARPMYEAMLYALADEFNAGTVSP